MAQLNLVGQRLDVLIRKGTDTGIITFSVKNTDNTLVDLSDYELSGAIYRNSDKTKMTDWSFSRPDDYHFSASLTYEQYQSLSTATEDYPAYFHEIILTDINSIKIPFVYGDFISLWGAEP